MSPAAARATPATRHRSPVGRWVLQSAALAVFVQGPTSTELVKYAPNHRPLLLSVLAVMVTFLGILALFAGLAAFERGRRLAGSWLGTVVLLGGVTLISPVAYHLWARHLPVGTPASAVTLAMTLPVHALLHGHQLYDIALPASVPASPGPGWILLNAPFALIHTPWLLIPFWLAVAVVVTRMAYGRGLEVNVALGLLLVSPHFFRMLAENQDLVVVPVAFITTVVVTSRWLRSTPAAAAVGVLAGVLATSRMIYLAFPLVLGLIAWRRSERQAVVVTVTGIVVAVAANVVAAIGIRPYPPAHLFARAGGKEPALNIAVGAVVTGAVLIGLLVRYLRDDDNGWISWLVAAWALAHGFIGFGELRGLHGVFRYWEGANYVFVGAVPLAAGVMLSWARSECPQYQPNDFSCANAAAGVP